jgi:hypothetical protein
MIQARTKQLNKLFAGILMVLEETGQSTCMRDESLMISHPRRHGKQGPFLMLASYEQCTSAHAFEDMLASIQTRNKYCMATPGNKLPDFT